MRIAIMQPYFFPYLEYFQLVKSVDKFVIYDDVNYIKGGWINRNQLPNKNDSFYITLPVSGKSSFSLINELQINDTLYNKWKLNFFTSLHQLYSNTENYKESISILEKIFDIKVFSLSNFLSSSIMEISRYLDIETKFVSTSAIYSNNELKNYSRVIDICKKENANEYVNRLGGRHLYSSEVFADNNLKLSFLQSGILNPKHRYSVIHSIMTTSRKVLKAELNNYELIS